MFFVFQVVYWAHFQFLRSHGPPITRRPCDSKLPRHETLLHHLQSRGACVLLNGIEENFHKGRWVSCVRFSSLHSLLLSLFTLKKTPSSTLTLSPLSLCAIETHSRQFRHRRRRMEEHPSLVLAPLPMRLISWSWLFTILCLSKIPKHKSPNTLLSWRFFFHLLFNLSLLLYSCNWCCWFCHFGVSLFRSFYCKIIKWVSYSILVIDSYSFRGLFCDSEQLLFVAPAKAGTLRDRSFFFVFCFFKYLYHDYILACFYQYVHTLAMVNGYLLMTRSIAWRILYMFTKIKML